jgi:glucose/arabinose dehydrogenase
MRRRILVAGAALAVSLSVAGVPAAATPERPEGGGAFALGNFDFTRPEVVATGLETPWGLAFLPDGSALVAERNNGRVLRVRRGQTPQQVAQISGVIATGEAGPLGLAISPRYRRDGYVCLLHLQHRQPDCSLPAHHAAGPGADPHRLYATEFGASSWDEVNYTVPGGNCGWPIVEGRGNNARFRDPIVTWTPAEASPSGAAIAGKNLFVAALRGTRLWTVPLDGRGGAGTPTSQLIGTYGRLRTVVHAPDHSLWVTTSNRDGRGTPAADDDRILRFPPLHRCNPAYDAVRPGTGLTDQGCHRSGLTRRA